MPSPSSGGYATTMREGGVPKEEISEYLAEATSGDYDNLLAVTMEWVEVD